MRLFGNLGEDLLLNFQTAVWKSGCLEIQGCLEDRQTDRQMDRRTDRWTDRQTKRLVEAPSRSLKNNNKITKAETKTKIEEKNKRRCCYFAPRLGITPSADHPASYHLDTDHPVHLSPRIYITPFHISPRPVYHPVHLSPRLSFPYFSPRVIFPYHL